MRKNHLKQIEHEVIMLLRRADFKRTLDGNLTSLERSAYLLLKKLREEGPSAIGAVAEAFQLDVSTVSRQVSALEAKGLIRRYPDPKDARVNLIEMTSAGAQALDDALTKRLASYEDMLSDWTEDELHVFSTLLSRLNRAIERRKMLES